MEECRKKSSDVGSEFRNTESSIRALILSGGQVQPVLSMPNGKRLNWDCKVRLLMSRSLLREALLEYGRESGLALHVRIYMARPSQKQKIDSPLSSCPNWAFPSVRCLDQV